jgi:hypothetical protein
MAGGLMPARRWSAQGELLHQADFVPPAPIDERGCRRDIRSNGWIVTLESVRAFEAGPAEETSFLRSVRILLEGPQFHQRLFCFRWNLVLTCSPTPSFSPSGGWCPIFSPETVGLIGRGFR